MTEDTSLAFAALNGLPGPYIKDFMAAVGHDGSFTSLFSHPSTLSMALLSVHADSRRYFSRLRPPVASTPS